MQIAPGAALLLVLLVAAAAFGMWKLRQAALERKVTHTLLEYQRGVLYHDGLPVKEVGSGVHVVRTGREFLLWADMRPQPVHIERLPVATQGGGTVLISLIARTRVRDLLRAFRHSRNYAHASFYGVLAATRRTVNQLRRGEVPSGRELEPDLLLACRASVQEHGVDVLDVTVTGLTVVDATGT